MSEIKIAAILLAAGASTRMGSPKQLLDWGGKSILRNAIAAIPDERVTELIVVLGAHAKLIGHTLPNNIRKVKNTNWKTGMGSSIACGMQQLQSDGMGYDAVLITLADQPLIDAAYLAQLIKTKKSREEGIIASSYDGKAGVPALFSSDFFTALAKLDDSFGAKSLLEAHKNDIFLIDAGNKTEDIDTPEEYERLNKLTN